MQNKMSRRDMLKWMGAGSATLALAACAPAAGPDASTEGSEASAPDGEKVQMSVATFAAVLHDWQREFSRRWAEEHADEVDLQIEEVVYGEMSKLQLARSASGTLWDVVFSGIKWFPFSASKGMFLALDDFVEARADEANLDDFFPAALDGGYLDGTLYGLPIPTNDWDVNEYASLAASATDADNNVWGTDYYPGNYYDFQSLARAYDTEIMNADRTQFIFNTDELNREAAQWIYELRTELDAAVPREQVDGMDFTAETLAMDVTGSYSVNNYTTQIGDKFNLDWRLFPKGPNGSRGYTAFVSLYSAYSETADPDLAVDLLLYLTSTEAGLWSALEQGTGQPNARQSVLNEYFKNSDIDGSFPMPDNLRFQELQDNWANTIPDLFYGDVPFEEGMQTVQEACQEVLDEPRA